MRYASLLAFAVACGGGDSPPSKQARQELATFLRTMDHDQDLFSNRYQSRLVKRADLRASPLVFEHHLRLEVRPKAFILNNEPYDLATLAKKLVEHQRALTKAIINDETPPGFDDTAARERIWLIVAPETPWKRVVDVTQVAAAAGYVHLLFLFDRNPATPPPLVPEAHEQRGGDLAAYLTKTRKRLLARCPELSAPFDPGAAADTSAMLERLAAAVETTSCAFDVAEVRSLMWLTAGNPYPHGVIAVRISPDAEVLSLPPDLPWREANSKLAPDMPPARFAVP